MTTQAGALCVSRSRSRSVSRNGARSFEREGVLEPVNGNVPVFQYPPTC